MQPGKFYEITGLICENTKNVKTRGSEIKVYNIFRH